MWNLLVTVRDFLLALALAWVGITFQPKAAAPEQPPCAASEAAACAPVRGD
ncbi:MAG: hypothetical protein ABL883_02860 [Terricaulis sp.]